MLLAGLASGLVAGCSTPSVLGPVDFPVPPPDLAADPTGAVVLLKEGTIEFFAPVPTDEPGPHGPFVVVSERIRIRVTGQPHPSVTRWRVPNDFVTRVDVATGRLARPDGSVTEVDALPRGAKREGDLLLELPAAQAGDVIDVYLQRTLLVVEALRPWSFAGPAPAVESCLTVTAPEGWDVRIRVGSGERIRPVAEVPQAADLGGGRRGWTVIERNVRAVPVEISAVDPQRQAPWAAVVLAAATIDETVYQLADSWGTVATRVRAMLAETMALDEEHARTLRRGATKARLREVRRALRPVASEAGLFDQPLRPFGDLAAGDASPIETAAVAVAAMEGSVEKANLALVAPFGGPVLVDDLPGLYAFRGAVLALPTGGGWTFAAPACLTCPVGKLPIFVAGGRALVVAEEGTKVVDIPLGTVEPNRSRLQYDWTVSVDGKVTGSLLADLEGFTAQEVFRAIAHADEAARNDLLSDLLIGAGAESRIRGVEDDGMLEPGAPYPLTLQIRSTAAVAADGTLEVTPAELAGPALPWVLPLSRQTDLLLPAPLRVEVTGALRLPPDYNATLPEKIEERMPFGEYVSAFSHSGGVITYRRRVGLFARRVPAERYGELMEFFAKIKAADNTAILIRPEE